MRAPVRDCRPSGYIQGDAVLFVVDAEVQEIALLHV